MRRTYKNYPEEQFCQWIEGKGFYPIKKGWPDFFCRNSEGKIIAVEVKPNPGEYLKIEQLLVMANLSEYGIECYRWNPVSKELQRVKKISEIQDMRKGERTTHQAQAFGNTALHT